MAQCKDINVVAYESGNSPEMIRKYYLDLVTPEQAKAWFSIWPKERRAAHTPAAAFSKWLLMMVEGLRG